MSKTGQCYIAPSVMGRWIIANATYPDMAWSGARWVLHHGGVPMRGVQVSNFPSKMDAFKEADRIGFEVMLTGYVANQESITCFKCGMTSFSAEDVRQKYCGNCHAFHENRFVLNE